MKAMRRSCASAAAPSAWAQPARACRAACCTPGSRATSPCWRSPPQGFERPLLTLVREWEVPPRGEEVSIAVDPESVLVFPAEAARDDDAKLIAKPSENAEIQAFTTR